MLWQGHPTTRTHARTSTKSPQISYMDREQETHLGWKNVFYYYISTAVQYSTSTDPIKAGLRLRNENVRADGGLRGLSLNNDNRGGRNE